MSYSLEIFGSRLGLQSENFVTKLAEQPTGVEQSRRLIGGAWELTYEISTRSQNYLTGQAFSADQLRTMFDTWLGYHVQERSDGIPWDGFIAEMELIDGAGPLALRYRRTLLGSRQNVVEQEKPRYFSAVRVAYGDPAVWTTWATDDSAESQFGRREVQISEKAEMRDQVAAERLRDWLLKKYSTPRRYPIGTVTGTAETTLLFTAMGYLRTAERRYVDHTSASVLTADAVLDWLITNRCDHLTVGYLSENDTPLTLTFKEDDTVLAAIQSVASQPDSTGSIYSLDVRDQQVFYAGVDFAPQHVIRESGFGRNEGVEQLRPRALRPGVFRDLTSTDQSLAYNSPFERVSDIFVTQIRSIGDDPLPSLETADEIVSPTFVAAADLVEER